MQLTPTPANPAFSYIQHGKGGLITVVETARPNCRLGFGGATKAGHFVFCPPQLAGLFVKPAPKIQIPQIVYALNAWGDIACPNCNEKFPDAVPRMRPEKRIECQCGHRFDAKLFRQ